MTNTELYIYTRYRMSHMYNPKSSPMPCFVYILLHSKMDKLYPTKGHLIHLTRLHTWGKLWIHYYILVIRVEHGTLPVTKNFLEMVLIAGVCSVLCCNMLIAKIIIKIVNRCLYCANIFLYRLPNFRYFSMELFPNSRLPEYQTVSN